MAEFTTGYFSGSVQLGTSELHKTSHDSMTSAVKKACELSQLIDGYVIVMRRGLEVASCLRGKRVREG